ncbi:hypothetical protein [Mongoliitalea lutea]|uniref:hypothetical protein n=1 Tax=Mongoliitalea lutea TaxID=849756 RepID=UPI00167B6C05|nr:hypothetical protein [Mongoliitalea lutea]
MKTRQQKPKGYKKKQRRMYYYKTRISHLAQVNIKERTIQSPFSSLKEVPIPERYYYQQLIKMGFNSQLSLFD